MSKPVVLFDGECGLCNRMVALLVRADRHGVFAIAGGQGDVGQHLLTEANVDPGVAGQTVVVVEGDQAWFRSDAVLRILSQLPFPLNLLGALKVVPRALRDRIYTVVADHRRKLADADKSCGVPPAKLRNRWNERLVTSESYAAPLPHEFEFAFDPKFRPLLALFGLRRSKSFVRFDSETFVARLGQFWVEAPTSDIACISVTGPYKLWKWVGVRESFVDHGVTFGTTGAGGVCVCFKNKVSALGPVKRHPGLTVTVKDPEAMATALRIATGIAD